MLSFSELIAQGASHAWLFIPSAILLGALHGLEPGHSKTMMAAFIVAIRGTVWQAALLGVTATISHTLIVWGIGLGGMYLWRGVAAEELEPYFQLASGAIIVLIAAWMFWKTWREQHSEVPDHSHHNHEADSHSHDRERREIDTGHGRVALEVFENGVPPRWRLTNLRGDHWHAEDVALATERTDGRLQVFQFVQKEGYLESREQIPEPHKFMARLTLTHDGHAHSYDVAFMDPDSHQHDHIDEELRGLDVAGEAYQDAHQLAHANDIRRRFANRNVTNWQIALFGLTGGLIPCPAAITVLLLCLQLKEFTLGAVLVLCFSIGLAITLVTVGAVAALSVRHVTRRAPWFSTLARRAPYLSSLLIIAVGFYVGANGWLGLPSA
ncbi:nickel/cobalt efflux transporter RcnA [Achromobacter mucicolens]|uniref:nickel/cobalt efflux transporter n=1 Tax=Achromobacter mucicolens TaxID=1389922 RepID=UPI0007C755D6|nr:nickel/cobalt efflux transporter [Achromobacter mucicolens]OAE50067.1 nickel/cobalt efflux protein RcnA [Achromobacter xylosoxidans]PTX10617.1 nickel/cobalt efflux transporter RcnA [Achromobacter mucicolens]